ncbi:hypothetical protein HGO34_13430 [Agrobacterium vitis]|uniref:Uncharacterized protein n=1 Tax=Agrobacterium vitis TaxID=373 RepID=A0A368NZ36_AGRVI|nr:hypothetical protein [Agrobacterium vitis]MCF1499649.1 hypothetical protein [Allorhizobium sp. Av2]KAA3519920.1 hypothetical protein DXM22_03440 [Agrobacterium vitis]KAA3531867.1 hypothetical protein DXT89_00295 [Agrobacterium vitis]MCF1476112.1 hypothetical protein [Agrobacterium vitis]MCM2440717.1 hypothetical protein [Agrobacterium vitis]
MMAKLQATWRTVDIKRAIDGARAGGLNVGRVEVENGRIILISTQAVQAAETELDVWERDRARKA